MKQTPTITTGRIYKICNTINNKIYIGQTIASLKKRFSNHLYDAKCTNRKRMQLYDAMLKYGIDNFYIELVEDNVPITKLIDREEYWIRYYDSVNNGYNLKYRTECPKYNTLVFITKEELEDMYKTMSSVQIGNNLGVTHTTVLKWLNAYNIKIKPTGVNYKTYDFDKALPKELLYKLYIIEDRTVDYISKETNTPKAAILLRLKRYNIKKIPGQHRSKYKDLEPQILNLRKQGLPFSKIAKELNCPEEPLRRYYKTKMMSIPFGGVGEQSPNENDVNLDIGCADNNQC